MDGGIGWLFRIVLAKSVSASHPNSSTWDGCKDGVQDACVNRLMFSSLQPSSMSSFDSRTDQFPNLSGASTRTTPEREGLIVRLILRKVDRIVSRSSNCFICVATLELPGAYTALAVANSVRKFVRVV